MSTTALAGCYVISLRPSGAHAGLRRAARAHGARVIALSPWTLVDRDDAVTRAALRRALDCGRVIATSPAAVRAAQALQTLPGHGDPRWIAVGAGTARALRRAGVTDVRVPARMDSDGVLGLPDLIAGATAVGLLTAPGGRDRIAAALAARGVPVVRADVYVRQPRPLSSRAIAAVCANSASAWLALSSGEALARILAGLPPPARAALLRARVAAASPRLAAMARALGFGEVVVAASAMPGDLVAAMASAAGRLPFSDSTPRPHGRD